MAKDSKRRDVVTQPNLFSRHASKGNRLSFQNPSETEEAVEEAPLTVGARLREAREAKGLSLHQVADILRLRASQVHALEEGDFKSLPGQTFVTGFLRSYANLLDLDAVAIVELYKNEEGNGLHVPSLAFPEPTTGGRIPGAGILLGTLVFALILLAGWFLYQESESLDFERVAELPDHLASKIRDVDLSGNAKSSDGAEEPTVQPPKNIAEIAPATPVTTAPAPKDETSEITTETAVSSSDGEVSEMAALEEKKPVEEASQADENTAAETTAENTEQPSDVPSGDAVASVPDTATEEEPATIVSAEAAPTVEIGNSDTSVEPSSGDAAAITAAADQAIDIKTYPQDTLKMALANQAVTDEARESPLPRTFGVENTDARVVLRATEESWVEVKAADEKPVLSRVLKPGDVYMAPNAPDLKLTTGNAGGLEIRVDGREIRSLGGAGTILREVPLAAESLLENSGLQ